MMTSENQKTLHHCRRVPQLMGALAIVLLFVVSAQAQTPPYIKADPLTIVIPAGQTQGTTALSWDAGASYPNAVVFLSINGAAETAFDNSRKSARTWNVTVNQTHTFKLYDTPAKAKLLATLAVSAVNPITPSEPPPRPGRFGRDAILVGSANRLPRITNVEVTNLKQKVGVRIDFKTLPNVTPILELSRVSPVLNAEKRWSIPAGQAVGAWPVGGSNTAQGFYMMDFAARNIELDPGTTYHYIINVFRGSRENYQDIGTFTTSRQTVKVVFTHIRVLDDSDDESAGDLFFKFVVNPSEPTGAYTLLPADRTPLIWESQTPAYRIAKELVIENAPHRLRILVEGEDDDASFFTTVLKYDGSGSNVSYDEGKPLKTNHYERNFARGEFDLTSYPGDRVSQPFVLQSLPLNLGSGKLVFDVIGRIEITRF